MEISFPQFGRFLLSQKAAAAGADSKPIPVKDIWGFYDYKKNGALGSTVAHIFCWQSSSAAPSWPNRMVQADPKPQTVTTLIAPDDTPPLQPSKTKVGGGGGGGDRDKLQAAKGKLPKLAMEQITPPMQWWSAIRYPKLAVEPTVVVPPQIKLATNNLPNLGDPMSNIARSSLKRMGSGGGIGSGSGGGVGSGEGPGVGPGHGGGIGGGVFHVGGGVSAPPRHLRSRAGIFRRSSQSQISGNLVLSLIVGPDGRPRDIHIARSLGLGLDEKAIEAVKQWKFEPAMKDGKPVAVEISVEVDFRLY